MDCVISIGAINAAIIAGNPRKAVGRLKEFLGIGFCVLLLLRRVAWNAGHQ